MNKRGLSTIGGIIAMLLLLGIAVVTIYVFTAILGSIDPSPIIP